MDLARLALIGAGLSLVLSACDGAEPSQAGATPSPSATQLNPTPTPLAELYPGWLLPNMRSTRADDLQIEQVGNRRRLRFAASLANVGDGPMLVVPQGRRGCPPGQIRVRQEVHVDGNADGRFQRRRDSERQRRASGCMLDHPTHDHWHFDAMAAYSLGRPGRAEPLAARDKVSFCLRDNRRAAAGPRVVQREYFGECSAESPQGISPGWVDVYGARLDGQWLPLPRNADRGTLCLTLEADPFNLLLETDETDNATTIALAVDGTRVRRLAAGC